MKSILLAAAVLFLGACCVVPESSADPAKAGKERAGDSRAREILIRPGSPDRAVVEGTEIAEEAVKAAFRWTGIGLQWGTGALEGTCIRLEAAVGPGRYEVRTDLTGVAESPNLVELSVVSSAAPLDGVGIAMGTLEAGESRTLSAKIRIESGSLDLFLKPDVGSRVRLTAVHIIPVDARGDLRLENLIEVEALSSERPAAGPGEERRTPEEESSKTEHSRGAGAPTPNDLLRGPLMTPSETRACLREACDYLVRNQLSSGLFDYESAAWWKASIATRALIAGYQILRDPRYLAAARRTLNAFVAEQEADGGWCGYCKVQQPDAQCDRRNLADLGSMTTCLASIGWFVEEPAAKSFNSAQARYLREFVTKHESENGSFRNGSYQGRDWKWPYSVATATQASSLITLFRATADSTYLRRAEKAVWYLLLDWDTNGQPSFHPHDTQETVRLRATEVHDIYYMLEAILFVARATADPVLRDAARMTIRNYILGERGLLKELDGGWFLPDTDPANLAKSCGILAVLLDARDLTGSDDQLDRTIDDAVSLLCSPATRGAYRILVPPYGKPGDPAIICTAFAGLSFAEAIKPGIIFGERVR